MLRAVVPLVCSGYAFISEFIAYHFPGLAAVVGALDHLPGPTIGLGRVQPWGSAGKPFIWYISQPAKSGPLISQLVRFASDVRINAPL